MACPARAAVNDIGLSQIRDHLSVVLNVLICWCENMILRRPDIFIQIVVKVIFKSVSKAESPRFRRDVAILVGVLIHVESVQPAAIDLRLVQHVRQHPVVRPRVGHDQHNRLPVVRSRFDAVKHIKEQDDAHIGIRHYFYSEIGIAVLLHVLTPDFPHLFKHFRIAVRHML